MRYRREIDGLRAVAVLPVILFHAGFSIFSGGYVGVDVFFVISGYLITSILISELEEERFSITRFYERRARRILPALFTVMLACLPFAYMWMFPSQLKDFAQSLVAVVFFGSNILFWRESGYFVADAELMPLLHTWSLAVEEQYYLVFPIFLLLVWRFGRSKVFWSVVVIAAISLLLSEWGWRNKPDANFYLAPTRAWELFAGSICAFLTVGRTLKSNNVLSAIGLAAIVVAIFAFDENTPFPSVYALVPVVGTALIVLFGRQGTWVAKLLSMRAFVGIGLISYSAYLWHQPLFAFARLRSLTEPSYMLMGALAIAALLLAWATWRWVEQPFRKRKNPLLATRRSVFAASGIVGAAFVAIGLAGHFGKLFEWRLSEMQRGLVSTAAPSPMRDRCHYGKNSTFDAQTSCVYFGESADVAIYGNSHGVELAYGVAEELQKAQRSLLHFTISGCTAPFQREIGQYCSMFYEDRLNYLLESQLVKNVILTFRTDNFGADSAHSIVELANHLFENGKTVILVLQAPTLERHINSYLRQAFYSGEGDISARSVAEWREINGHVYASLQDLNPGVKIFDLAEQFCVSGVCFAVRARQAMYFDGNHMSVFGARSVASDIVRLLE
jgi:peptidoglycan/LPS O-acetylase OafA/YrhL